MRWRMTNIFLTLSCVCSPEVKRVEVTCHLMYADFSCVSFYTLEVRKWVAHGEQMLELDASVASRAAPSPDGSETSGGQLWNYESSPQPRRSTLPGRQVKGISSTRVFRARRSLASSESKRSM